MKKAITHLNLDQANAGKLQKLDELAVEHQRVVQAYVNWLIAHEQPEVYFRRLCDLLPERRDPFHLAARAGAATEREEG